MAGFCLCGCGTQVNGKWVRGHVARVKNPSSMPDVKIKRRESMTRRIENGTWMKCWNRGLTKATDKRVASSGKKSSETIMKDPERRRKRAENCKKQWDEGRIRHAIGSEHQWWKGGTSPLQPLIRSSSRLHKEWRLPIFKRDSFTCVDCGSIEKLIVHHDEEKFSDILQRFIGVGDRGGKELTHEQKMEIVNCVVSYHVDKSTSGVTLCENCHKHRHDFHLDD